MWGSRFSAEIDSSIKFDSLEQTHTFKRIQKQGLIRRVLLTIFSKQMARIRAEAVIPQDPRNDWHVQNELQHE
jgi:hypothetical protein